MTALSTDSELLSPAEFLPWLVEMGADEILLDEPVDRFKAIAAAQAVVATVAETAPKPLLQKPVPQRPVVRPDEPAPDIAALAARCTSIADIQAAFAGFDSHPLKPAATNLCFISGAASSRILVLCDRPRSEEDRSGEVLAGKHQILTERMLAVIGLSGVEARAGHEQVTLANFMPWRPPGNRALVDTECQMVLPLIRRAIDILAPHIILALGPTAGQYLASGEESPIRARGKWLDVQTARGRVPLLTTFHPEALLKSPQGKRLVWQDLQSLRKRIATLP